jgi:hypothetical protein
MTYPTSPFGGGFTAGLREQDLDIDPTVDWLASEHFSVKRAGITIDHLLVPADADGRRIIKGGTALGKVTATGKYGPYSNALADGREVGTGLLFPGDLNVQYGDTVAALLTHGSPIQARCVGVDDAFKADVAGRIWFQ